MGRLAFQLSAARSTTAVETGPMAIAAVSGVCRSPVGSLVPQTKIQGLSATPGSQRDGTRQRPTCGRRKP